MRPTLRSTGRDRPDGGCELRAVQTSATRPKRTAAKARDFRSVPGLESGKDKRERQGEMLRNPRQACSELNRSNHGEHCAAGLPSADSQPRDAAPCRPLHLPTGKPPVKNRIRRQVLPFKDAPRIRRVRSAERCAQRESFASRPWLPRLRSRQSRPTDCRQPLSRTECCPERSRNPRLAPDAPVRTIGLEPASGRTGPPRCLQPIACRPQRRQGR